MSYRFHGYAPTSHGFLESRPDSKGGYHGGADNAAAPGTPVYAEYGGKVFRSGCIKGYGMSVVIKTTAPDGTPFYQLYGHLGPGPLPAPGTSIEAGKQIPGAEVGTTQYVHQMGGISSGPHLHREIISGKVKLNPNGPLGVISSDITHKADPDTFDINNPVFPYQPQGALLPPPQKKQGNAAPKTQPQQAGPSLQKVVPPAGNLGPDPKLPRGRIDISPGTMSPLAPGMAIPGTLGPTSTGGPSGSTPLVPTANSGSPSSASPGPDTSTLPPLHFAPEMPRSSGPFTTPSPWPSSTTGGRSPAQKPGGLLGMMIDAGLMPWNPNELASTPVASQTSDAGPSGLGAAPTRLAAADDASGPARRSNDIAPPSPSNIDRASVRRLSSPMLDRFQVGLNQPSFDTDPMPYASLPWLPLPSSGPSPLDVLLAPGRNRAPSDWLQPLPFRSSPSLTPDAPGGLPGLMRQLGAFDPSNPDQPPAGGLMRLIQEYMRDNPDHGATK
jgi:murein DD-endopeptidase MepM/ murein hydrolase activator NlpD